MSQRASQVAEEIRKVVSMVLIEDVSDPRLGFVTVTRIEVTDDLRFARIYYSVLGEESQRESTKMALQENQSFIRKLLVEKINMKFAMDIRFEYDKAIDDSFKIDHILKQIRDNEQNKS